MENKGTRRRKEKRIKNVFEEMMAEKFPSFKKEIAIQVQEVQRVPNKMNPNRPTLRHKYYINSLF